MTDPIQAMFDVIGEEGRRTRASYHLTLGDLIDWLENVDQYALVECSNGIVPGKPRSYRGYYSDLAFELDDPTEVSLEVHDFLATCKEILGTTLEGYKGGDFVMDAKTPLWLSAWGDASELAIVHAIGVSKGKFVLVVKSLED